jgi:hypothetical protein
MFALPAHDAVLDPAPIKVHGAASAVITSPDAVLAFHAASLQGTLADFHRALVERDAAFFHWTPWKGDSLPASDGEALTIHAASDRHHFTVLRTALSVLHSTWVAHGGDCRDLIMTVTLTASPVPSCSSRPLIRP